MKKQDYKNVLYLHLDTQEYEFKIHADLWQYIGGIAVSYKLMQDYLENAPIILTTGPLAGYFPYVSKANLLYLNDYDIVEKFGGGTIAASMNMAGIDAIVLTGNTDSNLHISIYPGEVAFIKEKNDVFEGRVSDLLITSQSVYSQQYFSFGDFTEKEVPVEGRVSLSFELTESKNLRNFYDYDKAYMQAIEEYKSLTVEPRNNPSCVGCPMGCDKSKEGEDEENLAVLPRSLIACAYAEEIYKKIPFVYSCLASVGYNYRHAHLEDISELFGNLNISINESIQKIKQHDELTN